MKKEDLVKQHKNLIKEEEPGLIGIGTEPTFAIGQRALLIQTGRSLHLCSLGLQLLT
jgi:hypothetical protein